MPTKPTDKPVDPDNPHGYPQFPNPDAIPANRNWLRIMALRRQGKPIPHELISDDPPPKDQ